MRMIYADHNATSSLKQAARAAMMAALDESANASSLHALGRVAKARVEHAHEAVAAFVGADISQLVFTSGGTEANVSALRGTLTGALMAEARITRLFVAANAHDSVRACASALAETIPGLKLYEIAVTKDGIVDVAALRLQLLQGKGRTLVSVMAANNETGAIEPLSEIARVVRTEGGEDALLHIDAVQAAGKIPVSFAEFDADLMTLSAHKMGGPQGVGALILRASVPFAPLFPGAQEMHRRAGTENVPAIAGFGAVVAQAQNDLADMNRLGVLRDRFEAELMKLAPDAVIFARGAARLANTSNFAVPGLLAETALIALDCDGIALSSGAACASGKTGVSHVLSAMGVDRELARCGLRLSLGWTTNEGDVDAVLASLKRLLDRKNSRKSVAA
jgi:cysteine desulfurase